MILAASVFDVSCGKTDIQTDAQTDRQTDRQTNAAITLSPRLPSAWVTMKYETRRALFFLIIVTK